MRFCRNKRIYAQHISFIRIEVLRLYSVDNAQHCRRIMKEEKGYTYHVYPLECVKVLWIKLRNVSEGVVIYSCLIRLKD
jgi:hypothetical protein